MAWTVAAVVLLSGVGAFAGSALGAPAGAGSSEKSIEFTIGLTGAAERPNPVTTDASGTAHVELRLHDGHVKWLKFSVEVCDIRNVTMSHIHAPAGAEGTAPVVLFLYGPGPDFSSDGCQRLAKDKLDADALAAGLRGISVDALIAALTGGQAYVNVHTLTNPAGEIRGQLV